MKEKAAESRNLTMRSESSFSELNNPQKKSSNSKTRKRAKDFSSNTFDDRTVIICDQCEKEYHIGCLRESCICDMKELPLDKWFCCQDCDNIHVALQQRVMKGASMIPFYVDPDITSKGYSEITESDVQWQILYGKESSRSELLSQAVAIFQVVALFENHISIYARGSEVDA